MNFSRLGLIAIFLVTAPTIKSADTKNKTDKENQAALKAFKQLSLENPPSAQPTAPKALQPYVPGAPKQTPAQPPQAKYIDLHLTPFTLE